MLHQKGLRGLNSVIHGGKVVLVATDRDGQLWYTVKQNGFEDSNFNALPEQRVEGWQALELPIQTRLNRSILAQETVERSDPISVNRFVLRACYDTEQKTAAFPVQLVSALGHIYIFRQSIDNTLLVDRFILDGITNRLNPKRQMQLKQSSQKYQLTQIAGSGSNRLPNLASSGIWDSEEIWFDEPTIELCLVNHLKSGWFSVVFVPTGDSNLYQWHIFAYNSQTQTVELTTLRASKEGLFDIQDSMMFESVNGDLIPHCVPGVIQYPIDIKDTNITHGLSATVYNLQQDQASEIGRQWGGTATRLMLAIPTCQGTAAFSFAIAADGTLSQLDRIPGSVTIRSEQKEVLKLLMTEALLLRERLKCLRWE